MHFFFVVFRRSSPCSGWGFLGFLGSVWMHGIVMPARAGPGGFQHAYVSAAVAAALLDEIANSGESISIFIIYFSGVILGKWRISRRPALR